MDLILGFESMADFGYFSGGLGGGSMKRRQGQETTICLDMIGEKRR